MKDFNVLEYLNSFINLEMQLKDVRCASFKLERMTRLLAAIGHPQNSLNVIHVAGSKGKGSTCAMLAAILKESRYRVGLYTSPHIYDFYERIRVLDQSRLKTDHLIFPDTITKEELESVVKEIYPAIEKIREETMEGQITWYEVMTAIAFVYFKKMQCDLVILETGLGGRLDATNMCPSKIAVVTPISLEHTNILGNTIEEIAGEKAGIIKDKAQRVVIADQNDAVINIFQKRCKEFSIQPIIANETYSVNQNEICLKGQHQKMNAQTVLAVIDVLRDEGFSIDQKDVNEGLKNVKWPLRFEEVKSCHHVILDGAHNQASAQMLSQTLKEEGFDKNIVMIVGFSDDKDILGIAKELQGCAAHVIFTKADHPRALDLPLEKLEELFGSCSIETTKSVKEALDKAENQCGEDNVIVVTGSIFVAAEARKILECINTKE